MTSEYRNICDICGKETKGFCDGKNTDKELALNNWDIRIDAMWWEEDDKYGKSLLEMKKESEVNLDACMDCAKDISRILKKWIGQRKKGLAENE